MHTTRRSMGSVAELRSVSLFHGCSDKELARIDRLACRNDVQAGTVLCRQGRIGSQTFVVLNGEATVTIDGVEVARIVQGDFFGEMSVLDGSPRVGTVTATSAMTVLVFAPQELRSLLENARVTRRMLTTVSGRLRAADRGLTRQVRA